MNVSPVNETKSKKSFHDIAHRILVTDRRTELKSVASALGLKYANFYARLRGRVEFRPEEIRRLLGIVPDLRLVDYLLAQSPFIAVERTKVAPTNSNSGSLHEAVTALDDIVAVVRVLTDCGETLEQEAQQEIDNSLFEAERALATLRKSLSLQSHHQHRYERPVL